MTAVSTEEELAVLMSSIELDDGASITAAQANE
jgi:hypothetical protein